MKRIVVALLACLAAICSGCQRSEETQSGPPRSAAKESSGAEDTGADQTTAEAATFLQRFNTDRDAVLRAIAQHEFAIASRLLTISGAEQELGGPAAADAALRDLMMQTKQVITERKPPRLMPVQNSQAVDGTLGVTQSLVELSAIALEFGQVYGDGQPFSKTTTKEDGTGTVNTEIADGSLSHTSALQASANGLDGKFGTKMKVNLCPDPEGKITLEATSSTSLSRSGGSGANLTIKVVVTRSLDDDAKPGPFDVQVDTQSATFGAKAGSFVDLHIDDSGTRVNRRSSQATDADVAAATNIAEIMRVTVIAHHTLTRSVWEKGGCVKLDPTTTPAQRLKVKPSTTFTLLAAPRSKVDGSAVGGTVRATLAGDKSLDPAGTKVKADAKYSYLAPEEKKAESVVSLESRSKRGVARAEVPFSTEGDLKAYSASGGLDEFHGTGEICDLARQFTISGSGVTVKFEPSSSAGGRYSYKGTMSGFEVFGSGTYQVQFDGDVAVKIIATGPGSVKTPMGVQTGTGTETYQLTPLDGGNCS